MLLLKISTFILIPLSSSSINSMKYEQLQVYPPHPFHFCAEGDNYVLVWAGRRRVHPGAASLGTSRSGRAAPPLGDYRRYSEPSAAAPGLLAMSTEECIPRPAKSKTPLPVRWNETHQVSFILCLLLLFAVLVVASKNI